MEECAGRYFVKKQKMLASSAFNPGFLNKGYSVYEVIRVINGKALFLEEHLARLSESVRLSKLDTELDYASIITSINNLISLNNYPLGNIKLVIHFFGKNKHDILAYFIPHSYPSPQDYLKGVTTSLLRSMRTDPNIKKLIFPGHNLKTIPAMQAAYEYLLVNDHDQITEGSKSNVFFITGKEVYTAPDDLVLKGITRMKICKILKSLNYNLITKAVSINDLTNYNTAFLTGTSPKVLPIKYIGEIKLQVDNPVLIKIMKEYDRLVEDYLQKA